MTTYLMSKRRWKKGPKSNIIIPSRYAEDKSLSAISAPVMTEQSPSSLKQLFPSLSVFNLGGPELVAAPTDPPPQFAANIEKSSGIKRRLRRLGRDKESYPSAFETYLFDDLPPGVPVQQGIRPVGILLERLEAWHILSQRLFQHFEVLANVETCVAKQYRKLNQVMIFPSSSDGPQLYHQQSSHDRDQSLLESHFAYSGGIRSVCDGWQTYHAHSASDHAEFATFLKNKAVPTLSNIKQELCWMIDSICSDDRLSLTPLTKLKREASRRLKRLDKQLNFFDKNPFYGYTKKDPWLINSSVVKQMIKVYCQENIVHETVLRLQKEILVSEKQLVEEFRHLCQHIYTMREQSSLGADHGLDSIIKTFDQIKMDSDWHNFCQNHGEHLVSEKAAYRHPDSLQYPNHTHALLQPVFAARMERRSTFLHQWHEHIYVLTPAGFLHEYRNIKHYPGKPDNSIFVPHFKVSSLSTNLHHSLIFQLQPHTASRSIYNDHPVPDDCSTFSSTWSLRDRFTWTLRAKSALDMERWIGDLTQVAAKHRSVPCVENPSFCSDTIPDASLPDEPEEHQDEPVPVEPEDALVEPAPVEELEDAPEPAPVEELEDASEPAPVEETKDAPEEPASVEEPKDAPEEPAPVEEPEGALEKPEDALE